MSSGPYLVPFAQLRIPMKLDDTGEVLFHAIPRTAYTKFEATEEAKAAIDRSVAFFSSLGRAPATDPAGLYEIVTVEGHEGSLMASEKRSLERAARKAKKKETVPAEEDEE